MKFIEMETINRLYNCGRFENKTGNGELSRSLRSFRMTWENGLGKYLTIVVFQKEVEKRRVGNALYCSPLRHAPPDVIEMDRSFVVSLLRMTAKKRKFKKCAQSALFTFH